MARDFEDHCWQDIFSGDILEIYAPYRRETYVGESPALLAIDLYNKVYAGGAAPVHQANKKFPGSCGEAAWGAIEPTKKLFAAARAAGTPVIYTTGVVSKGIRSTNRQNAGDTDEGYRIKEEFAPKPDDLVIHKARASGFFGTPLIAHLRRMNVESLIVCGESTSGCVRATVTDAFSYGFHTVVVEECVFDRSMLSHKVNLFDLHHKYADVMHVHEVLAYLGGLARPKLAV
ncbi:MAG: isochorismatase family protein [Alphaproteobacteria bacterium]